MVALGLESEIKLTDSSERVPTEVSSARLLRATKSELTLTGIDETGLNTTTPADEFVTVRL